jgi:hypothetical protein
MINSQDYDKVNDEIRDDFQDRLTSNQLKDATGAKLVEAGAFIEYQSITALGQKSKTSDEDYATISRREPLSSHHKFLFSIK